MSWFKKSPPKPWTEDELRKKAVIDAIATLISLNDYCEYEKLSFGGSYRTFLGQVIYDRNMFDASIGYSVKLERSTLDLSKTLYEYMRTVMIKAIKERSDLIQNEDIDDVLEKIKT